MLPQLRSESTLCQSSTVAWLSISLVLSCSMWFCAPLRGINTSGFWWEFVHLSIVSQDRAWAHLPTLSVSFSKYMSHNLFRAYAQMFPYNMNMIKFRWVQITSKATRVKPELLLSRLHTHDWKLYFLSFNSDSNYSFFLHYPCFREPVCFTFSGYYLILVP